MTATGKCPKTNPTLVASGVLVGLIAALFAAHRSATGPQLFRACSSPEDGLVLKVYRATMDALPITEGVDVIVTVEAADGRQVYRDVIAREDLWSDVEERYPYVRCEAGRFVLGLHWWGGAGSADFVILKDQFVEPK